MTDPIKNAFASIRAEDELKQSTRAYLAQRRPAGKAARPYRVKQFAAAVVCLALLLLGGGGYQLYFTPVSAISIDINPSIELEVNRFDRVVAVQGYNAEGAVLAAAVDIQHLKYSDAVAAVLNSQDLAAYLENDALVSITVIGSSEEKSAEMLEQVSACGDAAGTNVECHCGNRDEITAAHDAGLSFGKYQAFLEWQALDPSVSVDEASGLTMRQIRNHIEELSDADDCQQSGGHGYGAGNGHGKNH